MAVQVCLRFMCRQTLLAGCNCACSLKPSAPGKAYNPAATGLKTLLQALVHINDGSLSASNGSTTSRRWRISGMRPETAAAENARYTAFEAKENIARICRTGPTTAGALRGGREGSCLPGHQPAPAPPRALAWTWSCLEP